VCTVRIYISRAHLKSCEVSFYAAVTECIKRVTRTHNRRQRNGGRRGRIGFYYYFVFVASAALLIQTTCVVSYARAGRGGTGRPDARGGRKNRQQKIPLSAGDGQTFYTRRGGPASRARRTRVNRIMTRSLTLSLSLSFYLSLSGPRGPITPCFRGHDGFNRRVNVTPVREARARRGRGTDKKVRLRSFGRVGGVLVRNTDRRERNRTGRTRGVTLFDIK